MVLLQFQGPLSLTYAFRMILVRKWMTCLTQRLSILTSPHSTFQWVDHPPSATTSLKFLVVEPFLLHVPTLQTNCYRLDEYVFSEDNIWPSVIRTPKADVLPTFSVTSRFSLSSPDTDSQNALKNFIEQCFAQNPLMSITKYRNLLFQTQNHDKSLLGILSKC